MAASRLKKKLLNKILYLLVELLSVWERFKADKKRLKRDREIRKLKDNPTNWYRNHFDGVRNKLPDKADDADKASTKPD